MADEIKKCAVISGAPEDDLSYIKNNVDGRFIIAADSGYLKCLKTGITPNLIIGDFDSSNKPDAPCETIVLPVRKDDTDTFYAVKVAVQKGFDDIAIIGGIGSRFDHTYTNVLALNYCADRNIKAVLVNAETRIRVLTDDIQVEKGEYKYFSLFSLFGECRGLSISGAEFNLENYNLTADCPLGQSNAFKDETVKISFKKGKILLIECND